eukprot:COSAG02_NODE_6533_length_3513_cov_3.082601_2_plen_93_part_00
MNSIFLGYPGSPYNYILIVCRMYGEILAHMWVRADNPVRCTGLRYGLGFGSGLYERMNGTSTEHSDDPTVCDGGTGVAAERAKSSWLCTEAW